MAHDHDLSSLKSQQVPLTSRQPQIMPGTLTIIMHTIALWPMHALLLLMILVLTAATRVGIQTSKAVSTEPFYLLSAARKYYNDAHVQGTPVSLRMRSLLMWLGGACMGP